MAKKKSESVATNEGKIVVSIYPDELKKVGEMVEEVSSRGIRQFFGLNPTHRRRTGTELRQEIAELSNEEKKELLEEIRKKKEKN